MTDHLARLDRLARAAYATTVTPDGWLTPEFMQRMGWAQWATPLPWPEWMWQEGA